MKGTTHLLLQDPFFYRNDIQTYKAKQAGETVRILNMVISIIVTVMDMADGLLGNKNHLC